MPSIFSSNIAVLVATAATDDTGLFFLFLTVGAGWQSFCRRRHLVRGQITIFQTIQINGLMNQVMLKKLCIPFAFVVIP